MAERFMREASKQVDPVFNKEQQAIRPNISATQRLFNNLVDSLNTSAGEQTSAIVGDAQSRGVGRQSLAQDVTQGFNPILAQAQSGANVEALGAISDLQSAISDIGVNRVKAQSNVADNLQQRSLGDRQFKREQLGQDRDQQVKIRRHELREAERARAQAASRASSGSGSLLDMSASDIARQLRVGLDSVSGSDGHVAPEDLARSLVVWRQAGLPDENFWENFQGKWNPNQPDYEDQFYFFAQNPDLLGG